jgi:hypothetical protein
MMRIAAFALIIALAAPHAHAQQARTWADRSGALSIDRAGTEWHILDAPAQNPDIVLRLVLSAERPVLPGFCILKQVNRPSPRPATQPIANEMARLAAEIAQTRAEVEGEATTAHLRERDGVLGIYTNVTEPATESRDEFRGLRREFIVSHGATLDYVTFTCLISVQTHVDEMAALPVFMDRLRIRQAQE